MKKLILFLPLFASCAAFDSFLTTEITTEQGIETTVGDQIADHAESVGQTAGAATTAVSGNPLLGLMIAGAASALAGAARRKKKDGSAEGS